MPQSDTNTLVSTQWLAEHLTAPDVRIVDASWHLPDSQREAAKDYAQAHIPGAVFFDIDDICDTNNPLPHMLPKPEKFASCVRGLGLGDGNRIIVYNGDGAFSAARVWWMFRVMGHEDVAVLDGGLPKWIAENRPTDDIPPRPRERHFTARVNTMMLRNAEEVKDNINSQAEQVIDARASNRFSGEQTEPRPGLRCGHIPGSCNIPFTQLLNHDGTFLGDDALRATFKEAGIDPSSPAITSCGSGITAAILQLGLLRLGNRHVAMFDGSWAEWGSRNDLPIATGPAQ